MPVLPTKLKSKVLPPSPPPVAEAVDADSGLILLIFLTLSKPFAKVEAANANLLKIEATGKLPV